MAKKLSEDVKLRRRVRRAIESRKNFLDKPDRKNYREILSVFLEKFFLCEVGTKKVMNAYYKISGEEKEAEDINMPMDSIERALKAAGYDTKDLSLEKMFKKNNNRGNKSARDLRNSIVHDFSVNDIQELVDRWDEIENLLDFYLCRLTSEPLD